MDIYDCQEAFGASDKTTKEMKNAIEEWFSLYYRQEVTDGEDPCQRIAYTVVSKLVRAVFAEYGAAADGDFMQSVLQALAKVQETAVQLALVGGECYLKPWFQENAVGFTVIPRDRILVFARGADGEPTDVGTMEQTTLENAWFTLLERRIVDEKGFLTIENKLFRSLTEGQLGSQVPLGSHPRYAALADKFTYAQPVGSVGLARLKTPMLNCVDGSPDGVSVYGAAGGLIHAIDRNEHLLSGEFERGQSRVFASCDLLSGNQLQDNLFIGLDEDPERLGLQIFSPQLREKSFLERKQEYLRNLESVLSIKRGMLCDANLDQRTATEISASETEHALTVMDFQKMWESGLHRAAQLCATLGAMYGLPAREETVRVDWGNGVLFDEEKRWQDYLQLVDKGLLAPEIALGWRFNLPADTEEQRAAIREKYMPKEIM